jgi:carbamoyl-phosphate synthase large subunit
MYNIAVTGVGGGVGQSILKSLEGSGYNIITMDGELLGAGLYASKKAYLIPYANSPNFIETLLEICKNEKIALLFPGLDAELMPLSLNREVFAAIGTTVVVSRPEVIEISDNKQETYNQLTKAGVAVPLTFSMEGYVPAEGLFPLIIKQKVGGARSKNVFLARTGQEWERVKNEIGENDYFS